MRTDLIAEYKSSVEEIRKINDEIQAARDKLSVEVKRLEWDVYYNRIKELERQRDNEISVLREQYKTAQEEPSQKRIKDLRETTDKVDRLITLIGIFEDNHNTNLEVYYYTDKDEQGNYISDKRKVAIEPFDFLANDEFKRIGVFVVNNGKPKNRFSLVVMGRSIFASYESKLGLRKSKDYCVGVHDDGCNVSITLRDASVKDDLLKWYEKNKGKILGDFFDIHEQIEVEFKEAIKLCETKEWQIFFLEQKKKYYEENYSRGKETKEYKEICARIACAYGLKWAI